MASYESTVVQKPGEYVLDAFQPPNAPSVVVSEGPQGPPGPPGATYVHIQSTPAALWQIPHGLNSKPPIALFLDDDPEERVYTDLSYSDMNNAIAEWPAAVSGRAFVG